MVERTVEIPTADGVADAHFYTPEGEGPWPSVIMLTDALGVRPQNRGMAARLAGEGFAVLLPNLYYRTAKAPLDMPSLTDPNFREKIGVFLAKISVEGVRSDVAASLDWLDARPESAGKTHGVVGYCMTGSHALRSAANFPDRITAAASFHGGGLANDTPDSAHLRLGEIKGAVLIGHATDDALMPAPAIAVLQDALAESGIDYDAEVYPAAHGWCVPGIPAYDEANAEKAWSKLVALFKRQLG